MSTVTAVQPRAGLAAKYANLWFTFALSTIGLLLNAFFCIRLLTSSIDPFRLVGSFWASGLAASHHLNPYAIYPQTWAICFDPSCKTVFHDVNLNPPWTLPLLQFMARFPLRSAVIFWTLCSTLLFVSAAAYYIATQGPEFQRRKVIWLLLSAPVLDTLAFGEPYAFIFVLIVAAVHFTNIRRYSVAGILIGIAVAARPNLGFWPLFLLIVYPKELGRRSAVTTATLSAIPVLFYGPRIFLQWLRAHSSAPHDIFPSNISLVGVFARFDHRIIGVLIAAVLAATCIYGVWKNKLQPLELCGIAACLAILSSPIGWYQYSLFAMPALFFRRWGKLETSAAMLLATPRILEIPAVFAGHFIALLSSLPHLTGTILMLMSFMRWDYEFVTDVVTCCSLRKLKRVVHQ